MLIDDLLSRAGALTGRDEVGSTPGDDLADVANVLAVLVGDVVDAELLLEDAAAVRRLAPALALDLRYVLGVEPALLLERRRRLAAEQEPRVRQVDEHLTRHFAHVHA